MVLEVQNQQLQPLHVAGDYTAKGGSHNQSIAGRRHSDDLRSFQPPFFFAPSLPLSTLELLYFRQVVIQYLKIKEEESNTLKGGRRR